MNKLTVKQKILVLSGVLLALFLIYAIISIRAFTIIVDDSEHVEKKSVPEIIHFASFEKYVLDMQIGISNAIIENEPKKIESAKKYLDKALGEIKTLKNLFSDAKTLQTLDKFEKEVESLFKEGESLAKKLINIENRNEQTIASIEKYEEHLYSLEKELEEEINKVEEIIKQNMEDIVSLSQNSLYEAIVILLLGFVIGIVLSFVLINSINKSLNNFKEGLLSFFSYLNRESSTVSMLNDSSNDEFGEMAKVVNQNIEKTKKGIEEDRRLIDETITVLGEFEQGDLCQRLNITVSNPALMQLKDVLNNMANNLENNIDNVLNILEEYSNYHYLKKIPTKDIKEHLLKLANGVNTLGDSITQMLIENKSNGLTLDESSNILLANVDRLNISSNEAAASLEETAAALEQITSNIRNNTENIQKMASYSNSVTKSANDGEKLANQTTVAMEEINIQVNSINEAITVIDQIAFQTNILSLNAAVEAATAGEAGKGFAVVAQEVRNLASRSAEAAKEIKTIVENATKKANDGKEIASHMIEGYKELNQNITNTINLIQDIEMSSKEQLSGIEQINDAVNQLDQQTQQNAAVASQTHDVAVLTDEIAKLVVSNADAKEFSGKDTVKAKAINVKHDSSYDIKTNQVIHKKINFSKPTVDTKKVVTAKKEELHTEDEWESF
ncbi:4HB sensor-containing MCP-domain signal transduction protein [Arcobacter ellisii]|uniref:4HB sensor-containing MCP-domain signal transduction protein n=1 Tax=Arcobacter ellisii TaxID=913109 RepID=A0ABM6YJH3_9BACT|nr:methyl-accepting chemotaxis protein [Arcobacter ellisii]AXX93965.1 4HB sensor-containing MCP-domain signal transduction protein [Arcobacter ellisii]